MNQAIKSSEGMRRDTPAPTAAPAGGNTKASVWVTIFVIALLVPIQINLLDIRLSFYRIALLIAIVPIVVRLASSDPIQLRFADILIFVYSLTGAFSLFVTDASQAAIGIFIIESVGPYFLARAFIRNSLQFSTMARLLSACILVTIPFALYENLTRNPIVLTLLGKVFPVLSDVPHEQRLGFDRAQVTFDHPILYGVFCAFGFALAIYAARPGPPPRLSVGRGILIGLAAFLSLSSGALVAVGFQAVLILYDRILNWFRQRWIVLAVGFVVAYAVVEALSGRTVPEIVIPYLALNPNTAWTRLAVNEWAMSGIMAHPWFGFGFTLNWPVPWWVVTTSIDNFWLAIAFRHGLPTMLFLLATVGALVLSIIMTRQTDPFVNACRIGFVITVAGICFAIITVHLWNSTYVAFMFLLGSGVWMSEEQEKSPDAKPEREPPPPRQRELRFRRDLPPDYNR